jgi:dienelactone hydrolase
MGLLSIAATGLSGLLGPIIGPPPPPPPPPSPNPALVAAPASAAHGTMLMVHGGGWAGPGPKAQAALMTMPGETLGARSWRIISVDYHYGSAGLQDVLDAAGAELAAPAGGPLCIYGESAGAQLALVAASRLSGVDCVVAMGPPADFEAYQAEVGASNDPDRSIIAAQMRAVWGQTPEERAPNDPVKVAKSIRGDVLIMREADDSLIPIEQVENFIAARPTTERVELESAPGSDISQFYLHGTLSDNGRAQYRAALGSFVDRATAADGAEVAATRTGCKGVTKSVTQGGVGRVSSALRCLARNDRLARETGAKGARTFSRRVRGEINAARTWSLLRASTSGRRVLAALAAGRARTTVRSGNPNRVTLQVKR